MGIVNAPAPPRRREKKIFIRLWLSWCLGGYLLSADNQGDRLVERYLNESARRDAMLSMTVDYKTPDKTPIHLEFTWMRKMKQGLVSHLLRMEAPASERGKLLLVRERPDGGADYLAYRPNSILKKKVRISGAREYKFKGLSISVQELIGGELRMYAHDSKGGEKVDGVGCQVVENRLRAGFESDSRYPFTRLYLREDNGMPLRWELFGKSGEREKVIFIENVRQIEGVWTIARARVLETKKKSELILTLREANYHPKLEDAMFTEDYLKQHSQ